MCTKSYSTRFVCLSLHFFIKICRVLISILCEAAPPPLWYTTSVTWQGYNMVMNDISKESCVSRGDDVPMTKNRLSYKRCTARLISVCLIIWNRRALLIYSNVLNLVPNHGTRTLLLVDYYGLVSLFGQIRVLCLMSSVDWNPLPLKNTYLPMHITTTHHISC